MKSVVFLALLSGFCFVSAQSIQVKAEKGDGIFSMLRKQGLDPSKYYAEFVSLNKNNLKNGSELQINRKYLIPDAPDSYKKMALIVSDSAGDKEPIFNQELAQITPKSDKLIKAVVYLLPGLNGINESKAIKEVRNIYMRGIAQELMVHGAKVYLVDELESSTEFTLEQEDNKTENPIANKTQLEHFVGTINKHFLQNMGKYKYQRVVVLNFNENAEQSKSYDVSIFHHNKSFEGERFAQTLEGIFNQNSTKQEKETIVEVFENPSNLYLARNTLPPVTMIDIQGENKTYNQQKIAISPKEKVFTTIITNGVLTDYANLSIAD